jgi:uncharacterized protein
MNVTLQNKKKQMITKSQIDNFYKMTPIAVVGVSRNKKKFGRIAFDEMKAKGFSVLPVNSSTDDIDGDLCYRDVASLPQEVKAAVILTPKHKTMATLKECHGKGIADIWVQRGSHTGEVLDYARNNNINLIHGKCIMMFTEPVTSMHKFHKGILKLFGRLPK